MRYGVILCFLGLTLAGVACAVWAFEEHGGGSSCFETGLQELKRARLGQTLRVDQKTVNRLLETEKRYQILRQQMRREMIADFQRLQHLMHQAAPPEAEVRASLENLRRKRLEMLNLQQRQHDEETAILTPLQRARYLIFLITLRKQIREEARSLRGSPGRGPSIPPQSGPRKIPVYRTTPEGR